jgi:hypothetical protein
MANKSSEFSSEGEVAIDLESLGLSDLAYLRKAVVDGVSGFSIHAANGVAIGFAPGETTALAAIMTNGMELVQLH